ncbi:hypothetical protein JCM21714_752 [Gracilibacillus boraciitolerans JCM 21714]|uniref:Uncharacterized protein n=1 Tax=Gracilibacillus boraciitolerans JCM 21714 TaxID=1298598 RepID=W4VEG6_9BACI|nr:hypothetical protein JCM21714_752 [Gracilibacillus boraciitolerans JCM 21714]
MKNEAFLISDTDLDHALERFKNVKKGELLIGRKIDANDPLVKDGKALTKTIKETFQVLAPVYRSSMTIY